MSDTSKNKKDEHDKPDHADRPDKHITIVVNGRDKVVTKEVMTFREIVLLVFPDAQFEDAAQYTVTYSRGHNDHPKGTLADGGTVKVKHGQVFNVTPTDRS